MHRFTPPTPVDSRRRVSISVILDVWEIQCCVLPPAVGEETFFTLSFHAGPSGRDVPGLTRSYPWSVHPLPRRPHDPGRPGSGAEVGGGEADPCPAVVTWAGVSAYWQDAPPATTAEPVEGYLLGNRHGGIVPEGVPAVTGEVTRVQVLRRLLVETAPWQLQPVPGSTRWRDVQRSPRRFAWEVVAGAVPPRVSQEDALVIDLRVPSPTAPPST